MQIPMQFDRSYRIVTADGERRGVDPARAAYFAARSATGGSRGGNRFAERDARDRTRLALRMARARLDEIRLRELDRRTP